MHALIDRLLTDQRDCLAVWQLRDQDWTRKAIEHRLPATGLRSLEGFDGVWTSVRGPLTAVQRRNAGTLTAPGTALGYVSAALHGEFGDPWREDDDLFVVVTRRGTRGPRRHGNVLVCRTPEFVAVRHRGALMTPPARTLADRAGHLSDAALRRALIEALRLKLLLLDDAVDEVERRPRRPGMPALRRVIEDVAGLPIARCRSNAEGEALVRRKRAGRPPVDVNEKVAGFEADLIDHERKLIVEIDGPANHQDTVLDATKRAAWTADGYAVTRRPSADAYDPDAEW